MGAYEEKGSAQPIAQPVKQGKTGLPAEIKLLADIVIQLNILKKNLSIYPEGHHLISQSMAAAMETLGKSFQVSPFITIGAVKDNLFLGGRRIETKNSVFHDFALTLSRLGINSFTLAKEIQPDELLRLQRLLSLRPEDVRAQGDILSFAAAADLQHVKIKLFDYSMFHPTEEAEIKGPTAAQPVELLSGAELWARFTRGLRAGLKKEKGGNIYEPSHEAAEGMLPVDMPETDCPVVLHGAGDGQLDSGTELDEGADVDLSPGMIVRLLNDGTLPVELTLKNYADVLNQSAGVGFQRSLLGREALRFFERMNIILHNLKSGIRDRFLKTALQHISMMSGQDDMEELLKCFPADLAAEMMGLADFEGRELSPALQKLMQKFSKVQDGMADPGQQAASSPGGKNPSFMDAMQILPKREKYEQHMTADYAQQLTDMSEALTAIKPPAEFSLDEHLESLGKQQLDMHIGRVLIALMDQNIDSTAYHDFTQKVIELVPALLDGGSFRPMFIIFSTLRLHADEKPQADVRALAKMAIQIFYEPAFVRQMVAQLAEIGDDASADLLALLKETGQQVIPELIDLYANDQSSEGNKRLFELLCSFKSLAVDVAVTRLQHRSFHFVRNLLRLIRQAGDESVIVYVRPLLKHPDRDLQHEAIGVLLQFKDTGAIAWLRQQLQTGDKVETSRAVLLVHKFRITGLNREMLGLIKLFMPFRRDTALNCMVLQALGEIADPSMLDQLKKIAQARLSLFPGNLRQTKIALYQSLASYPRGAVKELLGIGLRSGSERIRKICTEMGA